MSDDDDDVAVHNWSDIKAAGGFTALTKEHCERIDGLVCEDDDMKELPAGFSRLVNLEILDFTGENLASIEGLRTLTNLTSLRCFETKIASIEPLRSLRSLNSLNLGWNDIVSLEPLRGLFQLQDLDVAFNPVTSLEPISGLTMLSSLNIEGLGCLENLDALKSLTNLTKLNVGSSDMNSLEPLRMLTNLVILDFEETAVASLDQLINCTRLEIIHCDNCEIESLPYFLADFPALRSISVHGNLLPEFSKYGDLNEASSEEIIAFLREEKAKLPKAQQQQQQQKVVEKKVQEDDSKKRKADAEFASTASFAFLKKCDAKIADLWSIAPQVQTVTVVDKSTSLEAIGFLLDAGVSLRPVFAAMDDIVAKLKSASDTALAVRVVHQLVACIPWQSVHASRIELSERASELLVKIDDGPIAPIIEFAQGSDEVVMSALQVAEAKVLGAKGDELRSLCEERQRFRREVLAMLNERRSLAVTIIALAPKLEKRVALLGMKASIPEAKIEAFAKLYQDFAVRRDRSISARNKYAEDMAGANFGKRPLDANEWNTRIELLSAIASEWECTDSLNQQWEALMELGAEGRKKKLQEFAATHVPAYTRLSLLEAKIRDVRGALDAEGRKLQVEERLRTTRSAYRASLESQQDVERCRKEYEDAVRAALVLQQLGYPELSCAAAPKRNSSARVPEIDFEDMDVGSVVLAESDLDVSYLAALPVTGKVVFKEPRKPLPVAELLSEASRMWAVRHCDRVVQLLKVCSSGKRTGFVLEHLEGSVTLAARLKQQPPLTKKQLMELWRDILIGVAAIHETKSAHLNIQTSNVVVDAKGRAKVGDFGFCSTQRWATPATGSAEVWLLLLLGADTLDPLEGGSRPRDVWSLGLLLYEMITGGRRPFEGMADDKVVQTLLDEELPSLPKNVAPEFSMWFKQCWRGNPANRPSVADLLREVDAALGRECMVCKKERVISVGSLCSREEHFQCGVCLDVEMRVNECQRFDGAITCKCGGLFEWEKTQLVVQEATKKAWQRKIISFREKDFASRYQDEIKKTTEGL